MKQKKLKPLYIWAGGKSKMIPKYITSPGIPNDFNTYIEPFFGGGAMFLYVLQNNHSIKRFIINDINSELISLYKNIKHNCKELLDYLKFYERKYIPLNKIERKKFYYEQRDVYTTQYMHLNNVQESALLYFLMKTGFNGIWQTNLKSNGRFATPSGLLNQKENIFDIDLIKEWSDILQNVEIYCGDWRKIKAKENEKAFYFFDPPYRDCFTSYGTSFNDNDHNDLILFANSEKNKGHYVFYCNREVGDDFYEKRKKTLSIEKYNITYTAGRRLQKENNTFEAKAAKEVLLY